jgi:hypothetical protein
MYKVAGCIFKKNYTIIALKNVGTQEITNTKNMKLDFKGWFSYSITVFCSKVSNVFLHWMVNIVPDGFKRTNCDVCIFHSITLFLQEKKF